MIDSLYSTPSITECEHKDMLFLQNLPSVVVSHVLDPQPGDRVLDMCAAPGYYNVHMHYVITLHLYVPCMLDQEPRLLNVSFCW